ncbi:glycoside hydrolase family 1 protein [Spiroplasma culicicola]|uniref:6-phospho-beta-glucosidase n=1 Tax=Spiroplasma culicicola AES-1 TaxID=1276246 RepID=W6A748_9MOLU|nr:glycoside hydrolase family 1 protein [Spiroplasma culicicola]AHI52796.1 6-phospho-beta-glucosidase [Spiroplasma culicicola AES-1]
MKFSKKFTFGAAISTIQTEGLGITNRGLTTFDKYYSEHPEKFFNNDGPDITVDITRHYEEDIKKWAELKLESIRFGFSWSRLFPDGDNLDYDAVAYYKDFLVKLKQNNIEAFMTLFHFDMPLWAHELGGWSSRIVIDKFVKFAKFVFEEYHTLVAKFVTFNEPLVPIMGGYLYDGHYPGIVDFKEAISQFYGLTLAHAKTTELFYSLNIKDSEIGIVFDWNITIPKNEDENNLYAAKVHDAFTNRGPLNILVKGKIDDFLIKILKDEKVLPDVQEGDLKIIEETKIDFLGINYYFPKRVEFDHTSNSKYTLFKIKPYLPSDARMNVHRGWEIYPESLYLIGQYIKEEFNNIPWYIAENGMGVENETRFKDKNGLIEDDYRIEFYTEHLESLSKTIQEGSNCFGYHVWSAIDCWSFRNGFKNRYGLIGVDIETQERYFKKSSWWFRDLILEKNGK